MTAPLTFGEKCGDCYHWNKREGECWRYPPTPSIQLQPRALGGVDTVVLAVHPPVPEGGYCGEWRARVVA